MVFKFLFVVVLAALARAQDGELRKYFYHFGLDACFVWIQIKFAFLILL